MLSDDTPGISSSSPIFIIVFNKLFAFIKSFTFMLNFLAIEYRLSPFWTLYVMLLVLLSGVSVLFSFIFKICPILNVFDVRLFNLFNSSTDRLNLCAIEYKVSPFCTVYVSSSVCSSFLLEGTFKVCPIVMTSLFKLFKALKLETVVSNFLAIEYNVSPFLTI